MDTRQVIARGHREITVDGPALRRSDPARDASAQRRLDLASSAFAPDPVESKPRIDQGVARRRLGVPESGRYLGSVGLMDERKGIDRLITAFANAPLEPDDRLLLVGQSSLAVRDLLEGPMADLVRDGRIVAIDRYVDNEEFSAAISALDVVCTPYPQHIGSASVVIRAAAAGARSCHRPLDGLGWLFGALIWVGLAMSRTRRPSHQPSSSGLSDRATSDLGSGSAICDLSLRREFPSDLDGAAARSLGTYSEHSAKVGMGARGRIGSGSYLFPFSVAQRVAFRPIEPGGPNG